jgi:hypothetical protein
MSTIAVNAITDANGGATTTINSVTPNTSNLVGKNLIINGNMLIDQRQAGAASTADNSYPLDRYNFRTVGGGGVSVVQSTEVPAGFKNSMAVTVATADTSIASSDTYMLRQKIEGLNTYQLDFGKSTAKTITLSFWVRSSLTGTFGGCIANYAANRSNVFQYTISTANTWEKKSITIAGDTTGTWLTNNSGSLVLYFDWGSGSNYDGTANQWDAANKRRVSGNVNLIGTLGATWYITGVQLEAGDTATEFEHRPYGTELQLCQRYYQQPIDTSLDFFPGYSIAGGYGPGCFSTWVVEMRATPTVVLTLGTLNNVSNVGAIYYSKQRFMLNPTYTSTGYGFFYINKLTASAEL